jgi:hypothetical protein
MGNRIAWLLNYFHRDSLVPYADNIKKRQSTSITFIKQRVQNKDRDLTGNCRARCSNPSKCNIFFSSPKRLDLHWDPSSWPIQWVPAFFSRGETGEVVKLRTILRLFSLVRSQRGQYRLSLYPIYSTFINFIQMLWSLLSATKPNRTIKLSVLKQDVIKKAEKEDI